MNGYLETFQVETETDKTSLTTFPCSRTARDCANRWAGQLGPNWEGYLKRVTDGWKACVRLWEPVTPAIDEDED